MRTEFVRVVPLLVAALVCGSCSSRSKDPQPSETSSRDQAAQAALTSRAQLARESFAGGAPSIDALLTAMVRALSNKDTEALDKLRVNKAEYVDLIVPGTVPIGQPPRQISDHSKEFFWRMLDTRSRYYLDGMVGNFGGRTYRSHDLTLTRPVQEYAWYTAHGEVSMELHGDDDVTYRLYTGWVAEVDGRYKFIGYNSDS